MVGVGDSSSLVPTIFTHNLFKVMGLAKCCLGSLGKHLDNY